MSRDYATGPIILGPFKPVSGLLSLNQSLDLQQFSLHPMLKSVQVIRKIIFTGHHQLNVVKAHVDQATIFHITNNVLGKLPPTVTLGILNQVSKAKLSVF